MKEIVEPFCQHVGVEFQGDERGDGFYQARVARGGQSAVIVIQDREIQALVAQQLEIVLKAWREQDADFKNKVARIDGEVSQSLMKKGFGDNRGYAERFSDYVCTFKAGGEEREVRFTSEEIQTKTLDELVSGIEARINGA